MAIIPSAAAYALAQDLKSIPPDDREVVCQQAIDFAQTETLNCVGYRGFLARLYSFRLPSP